MKHLVYIEAAYIDLCNLCEDENLKCVQEIRQLDGFFDVFDNFGNDDDYYTGHQYEYPIGFDSEHRFGVESIKSLIQEMADVSNKYRCRLRMIVKIFGEYGMFDWYVVVKNNVIYDQTEYINEKITLIDNAF